MRCGGRSSRRIPWIWVFAAAMPASFSGTFTEAATATEDVSWPSYNGNYAANRFSSLKEISRENVQRLTEVGRYTLPETTSFQSGPIAVDDALYVTSATGTYA